jgi:hypothetical protein
MRRWRSERWRSARSPLPVARAGVYGTAGTMSKEALVKAIKAIAALAREGRHDEMYTSYRELFESPGFGACRPEDQRQALRLMVLAKNAPSTPSEAMMAAHRSAVMPLTELVSIQEEPDDYEMLGICHVLLGNLQSADRIFREGLKLERVRNPQSDLCGSFMKRISLL